MEGIYIYIDIEIEKLYPGVSRPQSWIDEHPLFVMLIDNSKSLLKKTVLDTLYVL